LLSDPHTMVEEKRHYDPMPEKSILFKGVWITQAEWEQALAVFNSEMY